ncbi:MAG: hypothetical protein HKP24_05420, partial [Croceitalea sp.]|nr:hypothetical protein [Croceitalea sp.]
LPLYDCIWKNQRVDDIFSIRGLMSRLASLGFYDNPKQAVTEAKNNSQIRNVFEAWGDDLGQFLNASISSFKAEALIVQGGLSGGMEYFAKSLQRNLSARVVKHSLGSKAALLGASDAFNEQYGSI